VEMGTLAGERGAYRLARPLATTQVPATVQAVLAARIDRLAPEDKRLLQTAAVIGKDVRFGLLQAIGEAPEAALREGLARLQGAEFLYETSLFPDLEYTFKHALTHEVAYGSLLQERRRALHAQIVAAIETRYADRLAEQVERLAHHAVRGELWEQAVIYLRQAGAKAQAQSAHREAVGYLDQALEALGHLPVSRQTLAQAVDLRLDLRPSLTQLGELRRLDERLREAVTVAETLADRRRQARVYSGLTIHYSNVGSPERALEAGQRALVVAEALGDRALQVATRYRLANAYYWLGRYREAMDFSRRNLAALEGEPLDESFGMTSLPAVTTRGNLVLGLGALGEFAEGRSVGEESVRIADSLSHPFSMIGSRWVLGELQIAQGTLPLAIPTLERAFSICQAAQVPYFIVLVASTLGHAYALAGRVAEAVPLLEQAVAHAAETAEAGPRAVAVGRLSEARLLDGRGDEARVFAQQSLELARQYGHRGSETWALWRLAGVAAQTQASTVHEAEGCYHQALALAEELGMRPLVAHCHLGLGTLYRKIGCHDQAQAELVTATAMYGGMDMPFWLARAETELGQIAPYP
jgi:tetratricopeptide (TPR) repeat protein